jgi:hypothetical protein
MYEGICVDGRASAKKLDPTREMWTYDDGLQKPLKVRLFASRRHVRSCGRSWNQEAIVDADIVEGNPLATIRGEYREIPELRLTAAQARRLFNLAPELCNILLEQLVLEGFLWRSPDGKYSRAA